MGLFGKFFGKKRQFEQTPDMEGALRAVAAQVLAGQRGFMALQGLPGLGVTEQELVVWLREGNGREVLTLAQWDKSAAAEVEGLSVVAGDVVRELRVEAQESSEMQAVEPREWYFLTDRKREKVITHAKI